MGTSYLLSVIYSSPLIHQLMSSLALIVFLAYFPFLKKSTKIVVVFLLAISLSLFYKKSPGWDLIFLSFGENIGLLSIFIFVPLLSIPLKASDVMQHIEVLYSYYIKSTKKFYVMTNIVTYGLSVIMNLAAAPLMYQLTDTPTYRQYKTTRIKAIARGYVFAIFWSPYFVSMALVLQHLNVKWIQLFPIGFVMAFVGIIIGVAFESKNNEVIQVTRNRVFDQEDKDKLKQAWLNIVELLGVVFGLIIVTMILEHYLQVSVIAIISVLSIVLSFVWTIMKKSIHYYGKSIVEYLRGTLSSIGNEIALFITAGVFGASIINAGVSELIEQYLDQFGITHPLLLTLIIIVFANVFAMIGFHPVITVTVATITVSSLTNFMDYHVLLAVGLLCSWLFSVLISPFSGLTLLLGGLTRTNSIEVGVKINLQYIIVLFIASFTILSLLYVMI